jgi:hypothetical protein
MADQLSPGHFEDFPPEDARRMGRGPHMELLLCDTLRQKLQSLSKPAFRIRLGAEMRLERMKYSILHVARDLNVPITVRKMPGGMIFWRSTYADRQQIKAVGQRCQNTRRPRQPMRSRTPATSTEPGARSTSMARLRRGEHR